MKTTGLLIILLLLLLLLLLSATGTDESRAAALDSSNHRRASADSCAGDKQRCGGAQWYHGPQSCCNYSNVTCFWKHKYYAQCLVDCPLGAGWDCEKEAKQVRQERDTTEKTGLYPTSEEQKRVVECGEVYRPAGSSAANVCLMTHSDDSRFFSASPRLSRSWPNKISWAVLLKPPQKLADSAWASFSPDVLEARGVCNAPGRLTVALSEGGEVFYPPHKSRYPFNMLRNIAREGCGKTPFLLMLDADLEVFGSDMAALTTEIGLLRQDDKVVVALPTFGVHQDLVEAWNDANELRAPYSTKRGIRSLFEMKKATPFEHDTHPNGHDPTDFRRWFTSDSPYEVTFRRGYEPYLFFKSDVPVKFDEHFCGFGYDKVSFVEELAAAGYRFHVTPHTHAVHTHVHAHRISQQVEDIEISTTTGKPCHQDSRAFDRNILGGSCAGQFYARLEKTYGYEVSAATHAYISNLNVLAEACFGGCLVAQNPILRTRPPLLLLESAPWDWRKETSRKSSLPFISHFHLPKTAGTSVSAALVSTFCPIYEANQSAMRESVMGWPERCRWPCSGRHDQFYEGAFPVGRDQAVSQQPLIEAPTRNMEILLDTEFSCVRGSDAAQRRKEHSTFSMFLARVNSIARGVKVPSGNVLIIIILRHGTSRAISHWAHCMRELQAEPSAKFCTLGNVRLEPFRQYGTELFSEASLLRFSSSSYSREHWDWFRFDSLQVGLLASAHPSEPLTRRSLRVSKEALAAPPRNSQETIVGFRECLPELYAFLRRRLHAFPQARPPHEGTTAFRNEQRTPKDLAMSPKVLEAVGARNVMDNELFDWAWQAFPQTACERKDDNPTSSPMREPELSPYPRLGASYCNNSEDRVIIAHHKTGTWMTREAVDIIQRTLRDKKHLPESSCDRSDSMKAPIHVQNPKMMRTAHLLKCVAQIRRDPFEIVVSGYIYHKARSERWTRLPLKRTEEEAERQRIIKENRVLAKLEQQWPRLQPLELEPLRVRERFWNKTRKEYNRILKAPYGLWACQFINSTVALSAASSPGGALHGVLPTPNFDEGESYSAYLNRLPTSLGLLAEFLTSAVHTLPKVDALYRRISNMEVNQRELASESGDDDADEVGTDTGWRPCISSSTCLSEFENSSPGACIPAWARVLKLLGLPRAVLPSLAAAASLSCGAQGASANHSSRIAKASVPHLIEELRRVDRLHLNNSLLSLSKVLRCPLSKSYYSFP